MRLFLFAYELRNRNTNLIIQI